jgi:hypothetical protein
MNDFIKYFILTIIVLIIGTECIKAEGIVELERFEIIQSVYQEGNLKTLDTIDVTASGKYEYNNKTEDSIIIQPLLTVRNSLDSVSYDVMKGESDITFITELRIDKINNGNRYSDIAYVDYDCLKNNDALGNCNNTVFDVDYGEYRIDINGNRYFNYLDFDSADDYRKVNGIPAGKYAKIYMQKIDLSELDYENLGNNLNISVIFRSIFIDGNLQGDIAESRYDEKIVFMASFYQDHPYIYEDFYLYEINNNSPEPLLDRWTNQGAELVNGMDYVHTQSKDIFPVKPHRGTTSDTFDMQNPILKLDRINTDGNDWASRNSVGGDIITSHTIELNTSRDYVLSLDIQRGRKRNSWDRGFADSLLVGPEPRVVYQDNTDEVFDPYYSASHIPDSLIIEVFVAGEDEDITNIPEHKWRRLKRKHLNPSDSNYDASNLPALAVFGAGGYIMPFDLGDLNKVLPKISEDGDGYIKEDIYDVALGEGYKTYRVPLTAYLKENRLNGIDISKMRFRIRVAATDDKKCDECIPDDNDEFFIDNIKIVEDNEETIELSISNIHVRSDSVNAKTDNIDIPISIEVSNNTTTNAPFYTTQVMIYDISIEKMNKWYGGLLGYMLNNHPKYCRRVIIPQHIGMTSINIDMPAFNSYHDTGTYTVIATVGVPGGDMILWNDVAISEINVINKNELTFATGENDVEKLYLDENIIGLNLPGYSKGGKGNQNGYYGGFSAIPYSIGGDPGISSNNSIAMKFELNNRDTILGYQIYYPENNSNQNIVYEILRSDLNSPDNEVIKGSVITQKRGYDNTTNSYEYDKYSNIQLDEPIDLHRGTYYLVVTPEESNQFDIGASGNNTATRILSYYSDSNDFLGTEGIVHTLETVNDEDGHYRIFNGNRYMYKNDDQIWKAFIPDLIGNLGYPHLDYTGTSPIDNKTMTLTNASWRPMMKVITREKTGVGGGNIENCGSWVPDPPPPAFLWLPVELTSFSSRATSRGIDLGWETASEVENHGFFVERRDITYGVEDEWTQISFVKGNGTTTATSLYNFTDSDVISGHTYSYKLRQVDRDGSQTCYETMAETATFHGQKAFDLSPASPNPFGQTSNSTSITYELPESGHAKLEVVDIFGNSIAVMTNSYKRAGTHTETWNGEDTNGREIGSGTYIYRLTHNGETLTGKLQYRR